LVEYDKLAISVVYVHAKLLRNFLGLKYIIALFFENPESLVLKIFLRVFFWA